MFHKSCNRAILHLHLQTVTPLLIRASDAGLDPTVADLCAVRTRHGQHGRTVYIPGSSLKGVIRSAAEASIRGSTCHPVPGACEDPLNPKTSCNGQITEENQRRSRDSKLASAEVHRRHCLACRLFGSLQMKGRAAIRDFYPWDAAATGDDAPGGNNQQRANHLERRHSVSISRISGGVLNGPFEQELVPAGVSFFGEIALENYQVWQLGLLAQGLDALDQGFAQLGSSTSRGLGVVRIAVVSLLHEQVYRPSLARPVGLWPLVSEDERKGYGLFPDPSLPDTVGEARGLARRFSVTNTAATASWLAAGSQALGALHG